jgi:hypothetical protein
MIFGMDTTVRKFAFSETVIDMQRITRTPEKVFKYGDKELKADSTGRFESFRIILSDDMFNLPQK